MRNLPPSINPDTFVKQHVDASLRGLMYVAVVAAGILLFRLVQYEASPILVVQLSVCLLLLAALYFRERIPTQWLLLGICMLLLALTSLALTRFGLLTPALLIFTVLPIVVAGVRNLRTALIVAFFMIATLTGVGWLYAAGIVENDSKLSEYLTRPSNWIIYCVAYSVMVYWGVSLTASLTRHWRDAYHHLQQAKDRVQQEEQMSARLQRQQSLSQLSGGLAHDFNNILAAITSNVEAVVPVTEDPTARAALNDALSASRHGAALAGSLVSYANPSKLETKVVSVSDTVEQALGWIRRVLSEQTEVVLSPCTEDYFIDTDEHYFTSTLLNLILNARDAMPEGGTISVAVNLVSIDQTEDRLEFESLSSGKYVQISVSDTGGGLAEGSESYIYDPFYSTKNPAEHSGLGLASVYSFMQRSGGIVYFENSLSGATFHLLFKACKASVQLEKTQTNQTRQTAFTEIQPVILLVDDDKAVVKAMERLLKVQNYTVITALSGDLAWEILKANTKHIDLVLSDVTMPGDTQGYDLAKLIRQHYPSMPVVLMSGYRFNTVNPHSEQLDIKLLEKPVPKNVLLAEIESALSKTDQ